MNLLTWKEWIKDKEITVMNCQELMSEYIDYVEKEINKRKSIKSHYRLTVQIESVKINDKWESLPHLVLWEVNLGDFNVDLGAILIGNKLKRKLEKLINDKPIQDIIFNNSSRRIKRNAYYTSKGE